MQKDAPSERRVAFSSPTDDLAPEFTFSMRLQLLALFATLLTCSTLLAQNTVGTIAYDPALYTEGYTLIYPHNQNRAMLLNACGEVVHDWALDPARRPGNTAYLQPNGDLIMTSRPASVGDDPIWAGGGGATIERRTWDNEVLWSFTANNDSLRLHHDFTVVPGGNVIAICWEVLDSLECIDNGRDPALLTGGELWSDKLIELQPDGQGGADIVWEWRAWDHLVQDFDSTKANYGVIADQQHKIDLNFGSESAQPADWLHMNAVDYFPFYDTAGQIIMSVPTFNEVWVIWHDYQFNDNLIWRWGNPQAYDRGDSTDQRLFYQHDIHWGDGLGVNPGNPDWNRFFVFNNRVPNVDTTGFHSEAAVISPIFDEYDGGYEWNPTLQRWGPDDFQWTYTQPGLASSGLSSFQRFGNGGNLICSGRTGELFEITEDGQLAWEYRTPLLQGAPVEQGTELQLNNNLTFRADRYPATFPAFAGQDLSSGEVLEVNPMPLEVCAPLVLCEDSTACNFGEEGDCLILEGFTTVDDETGFLGCEVSGATAPYEFVLLTGDLEPTGINGGTGNLSIGWGGLPDGVYCVQVTDATGCVAVFCDTLGLSSVDDRVRGHFGIQPNPAMDAVRLVLPGHWTPTSILVRDAAGREVMAPAVTSGAAQLNVGRLAPGTYLVEVRHQGGVAIERLVVRR